MEEKVKKTKFFVKHWVAAFAIGVILLLVGLLSIFTLPIEQYPNIAPPMVIITANYSGADANAVQKAVLSHDWALQMHGFYADTEKKTIRFDVVISFDVEKKEAMQTLYAEVGALYPAYEIMIIPDIDAAD